MIITVSAERGIKCQVADLSLIVDPGKSVSNGVVLRTESLLPFEERTDEIIGAGEYEVSGIKIVGTQLDKESTPKSIRTIYIAKMDEISLCFLGKSLAYDLTEEALDKIGEVDVLFTPQPSKDFDGKKIAALIKQIEPRVIIPTVGEDAESLAKDLGQRPEKMEKFVTKKKELLEMNSKMIVIQS